MKSRQAKFFGVAFVLATGLIEPNFALAITADPVPLDSELVAKKSGGRSGGGSFKKNRPSRSNSPKRSSPKRTPSRSEYNRRLSSPKRKSTAPVYRDRTQNPTYRGASSSNENFGALGIFFFVLIIGIFFLSIVAVILLILKLIAAMIRSANKPENKIIRERDNDRVTVSMLQVALSSNADNIQQDLSELSLNTDTDTESGLVTLMRESALILLRNDLAWTHVLFSSNSLNIERAESAFDKLSIAERSKFSSESLSNIDGKLRTRIVASSDDNSASYVVVTLILGTADDKPLFDKINTETALKETLLQLASMRDDYLMKFELLWTPQQADEYLTDEELLMEYTDIISLA